MVFQWAQTSKVVEPSITIRTGVCRNTPRLETPCRETLAYEICKQVARLLKEGAWIK